MLSPSEQKVIQIDITNACPHKCSNCTRFVGHHKKPFMMDLDFAKDAIDSLNHYPRMVGIMGGEPTLHPQFREIVEHLNLRRPSSPPCGRLDAIHDFSKYRDTSLAGMDVPKGLWSSMGPGYVKHYELIQDSFPYQCLNDHNHNGKHLPLLVPRSELGIGNKEWLHYRDNCWVQTKWSAAITPKGAFFCEIAAALDMLFDGPGGWDVEPGWWKRKPADFGKQLDWCEMCSACLPVEARLASEGVDDVSESMHEKLRALGSKKPMKVYATGQVRDANYNPEPYLPAEGNKGRVRKFSTVKRIDAVMVCENYSDYLQLTLPRLVQCVDSVTVATSEKDTATQDVCEMCGAKCVISKRLHEGRAKFAKGKAMNEALSSLENPDWILVLDSDVLVRYTLKYLKEYALNPGVLYYTERWGPRMPGAIPRLMQEVEMGVSWPDLRNKYAWSEVASVESRDGNAMECFPFGYFQLFNARASVLRSRAVIYPENSNTAENDDKAFGFEVFKNRTVSLPNDLFDVIHLPHGLYRENWEGRRSPALGDVFSNPDKHSDPTSEYECVTRCQFDGRMWVPGERVRTDRADVPKHFRRIG